MIIIAARVLSPAAAKYDIIIINYIAVAGHRRRPRYKLCGNNKNVLNCRRRRRRHRFWKQYENREKLKSR